MSAPGSALIGIILCAGALAGQQPFHVYVGDVDTDRVIIAWGTTEGGGRNTIGRGSVSHGPATVRLNGDHRVLDRNWAEIRGLQPDTSYDYEVNVRGHSIGRGSVRTHPVQAARLDFFVIGDYGDGSSGQREVAQAMWREYQRLGKEGRQVRFVLTVGDNIYSDTFLGIPLQRGTGNDDSHWERKHFGPYQQLLREVPFYMTLGNHDGRESESSRDLDVQLDNFFFPANLPSRFYRFGVGNLVDFFALDTTKNADEGIAPQVGWLADGLRASKAPWKIVYGHHPPYTAGPNHQPSYGELRPLLELFHMHKVAVYFCGHEHNFQVSTSDTAMAPTRMFLSGAGGKLRAGNVRPRMRMSSIAAWAAARHFLHVEVDNRVMRITPHGAAPIHVVDPDGNAVSLPFLVHQP